MILSDNLSQMLENHFNSYSFFKLENQKKKKKVII